MPEPAAPKPADSGSNGLASGGPRVVLAFDFGSRRIGVACGDTVSRTAAPLDAVPVGQLTAPEITKLGIEMFAVCAKDASKADNSPGKKQARETLFAEKFDQVSKRYLQDLRRSALIEYK